MATPINAPLTSDIWHLSIDDLLKPMAEAPRLGGSGPFVINLSASSAPVGAPAKELTAASGTHIYQIQRTEDRRPRFRLRLGPFMTEDEADAMLAMVREVYPSALTATAEADDLRAIAACKPRQEVARPAAAPPGSASPSAPAPVSIPILSDTVDRARRTAPNGVGASSTEVTEPAAAASARVIPTLAAAPPPRREPLGGAAPARAVAPAAGRVSTGKVDPQRAAAVPAVPPPSREPPRGAAPNHAVAPPVERTSAMAADTARSRRASAPGAAPPSLESTQTLRPLTPSELQDSGTRWYVIQLSLSRDSFDPDSLPNLDIFNEYRLYSVAGLDQGCIVHALRLGFFADEGAAAAVASYLRTFYEQPTVKRISVAERERFRDQRVEARKDIGATGRHAVIEITSERHVREKRPRIAAITALAPAAALAQSTMTPGRRK